MTSLLKKILFRVTAVLLGVIVFFLINELIFRFFRGPVQKDAFLLASIVQKDASYLFVPNTTLENESEQGEFAYTARVNQFGYRGKDFERVPPPGKFRIMMVGDSFTHGVGAQDDETIPYLLEQKLQTQGLNAEVINAGIGHSSPITHYVNMRDMHLKYSPDLVILMFDLTDLWDDWHSERHAVRDKQGKIVGFDTMIFYGKRNWWITLTQYSTFCKYMHNKLVRSIQKMKVLGLKRYFAIQLEGKRAKAEIASARLKGKEDSVIEYDGLLLMRGRERKNLIDKHWVRTSKYILQIRDILSDNRVPMVLVMYPHAIYVGEKLWHEGRKPWGFEQNKKYTDYYAFEIMEALTSKEKIPFINTLQDFLNAPPDDYYFPYDGHLTPLGNGLVAETIVQNPVFQQILRQKMKKK